MKKHQEGDYISLYWDGTPEEMYVRGHVDSDRFWLAVALEYGADEFERGEVRHIYARWSMEETPWGDGPGHMLRTYTEPGPGRFKISAADYKPIATKRESVERIAVMPARPAITWEQEW